MKMRFSTTGKILKEDLGIYRTTGHERLVVTRNGMLGIDMAPASLNSEELPKRRKQMRMSKNGIEQVKSTETG